VPIFAIACETDHIAAWKSSFNSMKLFGSRSKNFIVSESGHIAGIINPPTKNKYGHYVSTSKTGDPDAWMEGAERKDGTWWPTWEGWLKGRSGARVAAREPGSGGLKILGPAPGEYVKITSSR